MQCSLSRLVVGEQQLFGQPQLGKSLQLALKLFFVQLVKQQNIRICDLGLVDFGHLLDF